MWPGTLLLQPGDSGQGFDSPDPGAIEDDSGSSQLFAEFIAVRLSSAPENLGQSEI